MQKPTHSLTPTHINISEPEHKSFIIFFEKFSEIRIEVAWSARAHTMKCNWHRLCLQFLRMQLNATFFLVIQIPIWKFKTSIPAHCSTTQKTKIFSNRNDVRSPSLFPSLSLLSRPQIDDKSLQRCSLAIQWCNETNQREVFKILHSYLHLFIRHPIFTDIFSNLRHRKCKYLSKLHNFHLECNAWKA